MYFYYPTTKLAISVKSISNNNDNRRKLNQSVQTSKQKKAHLDSYIMYLAPRTCHTSDNLSRAKDGHPHEHGLG